MIKIQNNTATREPLPQFLHGLLPESLVDLSWTDQSLGVRGFGWWVEENADAAIDGGTHKFGAEILTPDAVRKVVVITHEVLPLTVDEISAKLAARRAEIIAEADRLAKQKRDAVTASISAAEMASWPIKRSEAIAYSASANPADAPNLALEAKARGIALGALVAKVQVKTAQLSTLEAAIAGRCGAIQDATNAAATSAGLAAIESGINAGWPI